MRHSSQDPTSTLTLRVADAEDVPRIVRLAALDSARPPKAPLLIAEVDDELCVAVSLVDLVSIADPFRYTDDVRAIAIARSRLLRLRDEHLDPRAGRLHRAHVRLRGRRVLGGGVVTELRQLGGVLREQRLELGDEALGVRGRM